MYKSDSHSHCDHSHDSSTPLETMIQGAIDKGADYIALTDHCDKDCLLIPGFEWVRQLDVAAHFAALAKAKDKYKDKIQVAAGIECGYYAPADALYCDVLDRFETDVIINSVHLIEQEDCYYQSYFRRTREEAYGAYLRAVRASLDVSYRYDIVGHIGYVARKSPYPDRALRYDEFPELLDDILRTIVQRGKALEVNGRGTACPFIPTSAILRRYRELGGELVTFGSDAHNTDFLLIHHSEVVAGLKEAGFRYIFHYVGHKPIGDKLD